MLVPFERFCNYKYQNSTTNSSKVIQKVKASERSTDWLNTGMIKTIGPLNFDLRGTIIHTFTFGKIWLL